MHWLKDIGIWIKMRPGLTSFLQEASKLFEICVVTAASQPYAEVCVRIMDPTGSIIGDRIFARPVGPDGREEVNVKGQAKELPKDLQGKEHMVVILDDMAGVWPEHDRNLIVPERYMYFPACAIRFGRPKTSLMHRGCDEDADSGILGITLKILQEVAGKFSSDKDVRVALDTARKRVLTGCTLLFSGVIPLTI